MRDELVQEMAELFKSIRILQEQDDPDNEITALKGDLRSLMKIANEDEIREAKSLVGQDFYDN